MTWRTGTGVCEKRSRRRLPPHDESVDADALSHVADVARCVGGPHLPRRREPIRSRQAVCAALGRTHRVSPNRRRHLANSTRTVAINRPSIVARPARRTRAKHAPLQRTETGHLERTPPGLWTPAPTGQPPVPPDHVPSGPSLRPPGADRPHQAHRSVPATAPTHLKCRSVSRSRSTGLWARA